MDSDSSLDEENRNRWNKKEMVPIRPNMNDENSDVSDEENISRAARSIESPPESPQGTNFESPPASPDPENKPGTPSPIQSPEDSASYGSPVISPDSQTDSHAPRNESPPRSPDSYMPRSPSPVRFANRSPPSEPRSQSPTTNYPRSPSPIHSPNSNHSVRNRSPDSIQSPAQIHSPRSPNTVQSPTPANEFEIQSPSQRSQSPNSIRSPSSYQSSHQIDSPHGHGSESPQPDSSPRRFKGRRTPSQSPQSTHRSPPPVRTRKVSENSDDGRSNISSASSFSSPCHSPAARPCSPAEPSAPIRVKTVAELKSHVEDLSDVSDLESLNSMSDDEPEKLQLKENGDVRGRSDKKNKEISMLNTSAGGLEEDDTEQLDFEAEEKEEGECEVAAKSQPCPKKDAVVSEDEGELKGEELEEGEISDEGENRPEETEPRPVCRFYNRGQCTWGSSCRFVHPGVTDKGNYTMFEMVRPLVPINGPPPMYGPPPMDPFRPPPMAPMAPMMERPMMGPPVVYQQPPPPRKEEMPPPVVESAWERGLRQAKEMLRKSSKRKETEVDFEEKKMNLSIGQDDLDKENDYYTRAASPVPIDDSERWRGKGDGESKKYRTMSERFEDYGGGAEFYHQRNTEQVWHQRPHYDESMRGMYSRSSSKHYQPSREHSSRSSREKEYYSSSKTKKYTSQREVIVQRPEKTSSWKEDSPPVKPSRYSERTGGRGDEWADPWMRSKTSPLSRKRSRKASYSSGSSYSSSSSSHSSRTSSSSYSRSQSKSRSSRSRSRSKASKLSPPRRLIRTSPSQGKGLKVPMAAMPLVEKKGTAERAMMMMNPPPPSPRGKPKPLAANPSPPVERVRPGGVPARVQKAASAVAAAMRSARSRSKSSRSSGSSDSSGSSSDSSESSFSSSSSSRPASPPVRQKRIVIDERIALAQAMNMKVKAMDALKLSGQKQQIKLTLKGSVSGDRTMPVATMAGKKRPAESPSPPRGGGKTTPKKTAPSRREELLKQLKAVEDAIARKRSKIS